MVVQRRWLLVVVLVVSALLIEVSPLLVQAQSAPTVTLGENPTLGRLLTANGGLTLYRFLNDEENTSNCNGGCASVWPPLLIGDGLVPSGGAGVTGALGAIVRQDGRRQVTYNGLPLYFFAGNAAAPADTQPGSTNGQGIGQVWFVVKAETSFVGRAVVTVAARNAGAAGVILTASDGFTLYQFRNDTGGQSVCYDGCARVWPPLLVGKDVLPAASSGVRGPFGITIRRDGSRQVTYQGSPLYFFAGNATVARDMAPGDTNGQGIGGVWFVYTANGVFLPFVQSAAR